MHARTHARTHLADISLRFLRGIVGPTVLLAAVAGCGNTNTGAMDGGDGGAVVGDVIEYGVRGRPPNNRFCDQLAASPTPILTRSPFIAICRPDAPPGTTCPEATGRCLRIERVPDLAEYARNNRVPQICSEGSGWIPRCDNEAHPGCGDGAFCAYAHYLGEVWPMCVPYPCNP